MHCNAPPPPPTPPFHTMPVSKRRRAPYSEHMRRYTYSGLGTPNVVPSSDSILRWLNGSIFARVFTDPICGDGVCDATESTGDAEGLLGCSKVCACARSCGVCACPHAWCAFALCIYIQPARALSLSVCRVTSACRSI